MSRNSITPSRAFFTSGVVVLMFMFGITGIAHDATGFGRSSPPPPGTSGSSPRWTAAGGSKNEGRPRQLARTLAARSRPWGPRSLRRRRTPGRCRSCCAAPRPVDRRRAGRGWEGGRRVGGMAFGGATDATTTRAIGRTDERGWGEHRPRSAARRARRRARARGRPSPRRARARARGRRARARGEDDARPSSPRRDDDARKQTLDGRRRRPSAEEGGRRGVDRRRRTPATEVRRNAVRACESPERKNDVAIATDARLEFARLARRARRLLKCARGAARDGRPFAEKTRSRSARSEARSIQKFFTHRPVSTFDRLPFQLTGNMERQIS